MGKSTISMAIFNSYLSLPEGKLKMKMDQTVLGKSFMLLKSAFWSFDITVENHILLSGKTLHKFAMP